jgi:hypothetical protein
VAPSVFGKYRDSVIGIDETDGKIAVIEWGDNESVIKLVTVHPWRVALHTVNAGRLTGIDGPMRFDFTDNRFLFSTENTVTTIGLDGSKRTYTIPVSKSRGIARFLPAKGSIFVVPGSPELNPTGGSLYQVASNGDHPREVFHSDTDRVVFLDVVGKDVCGVHGQKVGQPKLMLMNCDSLAKKEYPLNLPGAVRWELAGDSLLSLSDDGVMLYRVPLSSPEKVHKYPLPNDNRCGISAMKGSRDYAVLMRQNSDTGYHSHIVVELATGKTRTVAAGQYQSYAWALRHAGKGFLILSE